MEEQSLVRESSLSGTLRTSYVRKIKRTLDEMENERTSYVRKIKRTLDEMENKRTSYVRKIKRTLDEMENKRTSYERKRIMLHITKWLLEFLLGTFVGLLPYLCVCYLFTTNFRYDNFEILSQELQKQVNQSFLLEQLHLYSSDLHQAGSSKNLELANKMKSNWKLWGVLHVNVLKYPINQTKPNINHTSSVSLLSKNGTVLHKLKTMELNNTFPIFHSYSVGGKAQGNFVFINYGLISDLKLLINLNISFCGNTTIPIVRLGFSMRSAKVKNLIKHCSMSNLPAALLVYPDPWDYAVNYTKPNSTPQNTPTYPHSWWLPGDAAVLGNMKIKSGLQSDGMLSVVDFSQLETPFPVQPINYNDAKILFNAMTETRKPVKWKNSLPTYLQSSDEYTLSLHITNIVQETQLSNVLGYIPANTTTGQPDERYVILGNHRDAWAFGASDPGSGTVILQQVTKILAEAYRQGKYKPIRGLMFASRDGEEESLFGSTEFTSQFSKLQSDTIAYVNMDCPIKGNYSFNGRCTPLLQDALMNSSRNVHISSTRTLFDDWKQKNPNKRNPNEPKVSDLGGGSDHNLFAYVLGIPSSYPEYKYQLQLPSMPTYHTVVDNIDYMLNFIDPGLAHHVLVSRLVLDYIIRLTCAPIVPYKCQRLSNIMKERYPSLETKLRNMATKIGVDYSPVLSKDLNSFYSACDSFQKTIDSNYNDIVTNYTKLNQVNQILLKLPRAFITRDGLPLRSSLHNILLSTRMTNSYLGSMFTGVYDALDLYESGSIVEGVLYRQLSLLSNSLRDAETLLLDTRKIL